MRPLAVQITLPYKIPVPSQFFSFNTPRRNVSALPSPTATLRNTAQARISAVDARFGKLDLTKLTSVRSTPTLSSSKVGISQDLHRHQPLVDNFRRKHDYLRISLTEKCNLRCFYCMPEEGVELLPTPNILSDNEVIRLAELFVRNGVKKIRLTGGEPTIRKGIVELIGRLSQLHPLGLESIGVTSNGLAVHRKLPQMIERGLTHLNLSLDTLDPIKFEQITRRKGHDAVLKTLDIALQSVSTPENNLRSVKLNVVIINGINDNELLDFIEMTRAAPLNVRFIEFMPFSGNKWDKSKLIPSSQLLAQIIQRYPGVSKALDGHNDTARSYAIPGFKGSFGFISSMSDHFCSTCNRLRITADGKIKVCLFDGSEISLQDQMRSGATDEQLMNIIGYAVGNKKEKHDVMGEIDTIANRPMILIGGLKVRPPISLWNSFGRWDHLSSLVHHDLLLRQHSPGQLQKSVRWFNSSASLQAEKLGHIDASGRPSMVNVSHKAITHRSATAMGRIYLTPDTFPLIYPEQLRDGSSISNVEQKNVQVKALSKGAVLHTAQLAGILAAKQTSNLIPLCHSGIPLTHISVIFTPEPSTSSVKCEATVECDGKTGVEMEALVAVNGSLLCVWDMVKAVAGRKMRIGDICVTRKSGGKSGDWKREDVT
ncbi:hypothetical protein FRB93_011359 [Tulasnella sp. JGI-2019a]|nr:hypothetical protein FRB93_011359 [Tulasnella sp. JGI-2019a]